MQYSIYPKYDSTIYEKYPTKNAGIDQILELNKISQNTVAPGDEYWESTYNSRILLTFDIQFLSSSIQEGQIGKSSRYFLNLYATEASDLPFNHNIYAHPVSSSWINGSGYANDDPINRYGVSWRFRDGYFNDNGTRWASSSYSPNVTGSWASIQGGGNWYYGSGYVASQSFEGEDPDIRMDVTDIVHKWLSGSIENNGFIIKRSDYDESSLDSFGEVKFFGRETHTIFIPRLDAVWDDSDLSGTGSFLEVSGEDFVIHFKNNKNVFRESEKSTFRLHVRDRFPVRTFSTSSNFLSKNRLPTSSYYAIQDSQTNLYIVPFDSRNKISCDSNGNFFRVNFNTFLPDRYYKVIIKSEFEGGNVVKIVDDSIYFKVVR